MDLHTASYDFQGGLMSMQTRISRNKLALWHSSAMVLRLTSSLVLAKSEERHPGQFEQLQWLNEELTSLKK